MADIQIASIDLAQGLKVKNLAVPKMMAEVVLSNAPKEIEAAFDKDKLIGQKLLKTAFEALNEAKKTFQEAAIATDEIFEKKPPKDEKEAEDRVKTLNVICRQIAEAQGGKATKAVEAEWATYVKKNKALTKYRALFAARLGLGVISVAANVAHTVMTFGASSAVAILGIAKTVVSIGTDIYNQARDISKAENDIIETDIVLAKVWTEKAVGAKQTGRELAAALGAPFVKSISGLGKLLTEYNAKIAVKDKSTEDLWKKAKNLMEVIEKTSQDNNPQLQKAVKALGTKTTELLDKITDLNAKSSEYDGFYAAYKNRYDTYRTLEGKALGHAAKGTEGVIMLAGIVSTGKTIVDLASALA